MWLFYAVGASVIWGLNYTLTERVLRRLAAPSMLGLQMLMGALFFLTLSYKTNTLQTDVATLWRERGTLVWFVVAIIASNAANLLICLSIGAKNATMAGLVEQSYPLATLFFTWVLFQENRLTPSVALGGLLVFAGIVVISRGS